MIFDADSCVGNERLIPTINKTPSEDGIPYDLSYFWEELLKLGLPLFFLYDLWDDLHMIDEDLFHVRNIDPEMVGFEGNCFE